MAVDTLQSSPLVLNSDRLVSMAGTLLAKKNQENKLAQKGLTDFLAKIDSAKIITPDIEGFKKKYDDYVSYGMSNLNNMDNIDVQVKLNQMGNDLRGFVSRSVNSKDEDIKLASLLVDPNISPLTKPLVQQRIQMTSEERASIPFDYTQIKKVDDKDYFTEVSKNWTPDMNKVYGDIKYQNNLSLMASDLRNSARDYAKSIIGTETGDKAFLEFIENNKIQATTANEIAAAVQKFGDKIYELRSPNLSQNITKFNTDKDKTSEGDKKRSEREGIVDQRAQQIYQITKDGSLNAKWKQDLKAKSAPGLKITENLATNEIIFEEIDPLINKYKQVYSPIKRTNDAAFFSNINAVLSSLDKAGVSKISNEEVNLYVNSDRGKKYLNSVMMKKPAGKSKNTAVSPVVKTKSVVKAKPTESEEALHDELLFK